MQAILGYSKINLSQWNPPVTDNIHISIVTDSINLLVLLFLEGKLLKFLVRYFIHLFGY